MGAGSNDADLEEPQGSGGVPSTTDDDVISSDDDVAPDGVDPGNPSIEPEPAGDDDVSAPDPTTENPSTLAECEGPRVLPSQPLRRLSSDEYHNTLADLFGEALGSRVVQGSMFPETLVESGFSTDAEANVVNTAESNAIEDNAERIAVMIDQDPQPFLEGLLPCTVSNPATGPEITGCIDSFITDFGLRAYRRPLTESEVGLARGVYDAVRADNTPTFAFAALVQYFVESPALLYRVERGVGGPNAELLRLDGYERATRLSYFLRGTTPDAELLQAAADDALATPEQVRAQAERLLNEDSFYEVSTRFHRDWLELHGYDYKDPSLFPTFDPARNSLAEEPGRYVRRVLEQGDGTIASILAGDTFPVNAALAEYYGVDAPGASDDTWVDVAIPNRRGLLTQGILMATLANSTATNPIHRGGFVQTQLLCRALPALPGSLDIQTPLQDTSDLPTARERLSPLEEGACSVCHQAINPVGLAFENYDAAGVWRDQENGSNIDASGSVQLGGQSVAFDGPVALVEALAASDEAEQCYALNWYRVAMGRPEFAEDACSTATVQQASETSGGDIRAMLLALVQTDAFLFRRRNEP